MAHKAIQQTTLGQLHVRGHPPLPCTASCHHKHHRHHLCIAQVTRHDDSSQAVPIPESNRMQGVHCTTPERLQPLRMDATLSIALATSLIQGGCALAVEPSTVQQLQLGPKDPGFEIWVGLAAGVIPFLIGSWEFGKRIVIQRRCELCGGRGLVPSTNPTASYLRKCPQCGGFFPWISWKMFLTSTATPGNGGPLQQPRGQKSVFYEVPAAAPTKEQVQAARAAYMAQAKQASEGDGPAGGLQEPSGDPSVSASSSAPGIGKE